MRKSYENFLHKNFAKDQDTLIEQSIFANHEILYRKFFQTKIKQIRVYVCTTENAIHLKIAMHIVLCIY